jgi:hypothetical protein
MISSAVLALIRHPFVMLRYNNVTTSLHHRYMVTPGMISSAVLALIRHPHVMCDLRRSPENIFDMLNEIARFTSPVVRILRKLPEESEPFTLTETQCQGNCHRRDVHAGIL